MSMLAFQQRSTTSRPVADPHWMVREDYLALVRRLRQLPVPTLEGSMMSVHEQRMGRAMAVEESMGCPVSIEVRVG